MRIDSPKILEGSSLQNATIPSGDSAPSLPSLGELFYFTSTAVTGFTGLHIYNGTTWAQVAGTGGSGGSSGSGATGGGTDKVFFENDKSVTASYAIPTNKNALTAGPVTVQNGVTVTVPNGSTWTIV